MNNHLKSSQTRRDERVAPAPRAPFPALHSQVSLRLKNSRKEEDLCGGDWRLGDSGPRQKGRHREGSGTPTEKHRKKKKGKISAEQAS